MDFVHPAYETYRECLRNHAASLGSYATDGCGEFTPDEDSIGGLMCAACDCHRNFHRKVIVALEVLGSSSMRKMSSIDGSLDSDRMGSKRRVRTKFSVEQKERMLIFAEKIGWKMQRKEQENEIENFCADVGISRQVFKVWLHNHKNISSCASSTTGNASNLTQ